MDITNPLEAAIQTDNQPNKEQEAPKPDAVQARINELTAEKYAKDEQIKQLSNTVADLVRRSTEQVQMQKQHEPEVPEGVDPGMAKWLLSQIQAVQKTAQETTEQMYWRMQHQMDQQNVASRYSTLPVEVQQDAARRLTGLKQRYGEQATMDDAIKLSLGEYAMKQMGQGQARAFNNMNTPITAQSGLPNITPQSQALVPPTQRPDWNRLTIDQQVKLVDEFEAKGGRLLDMGNG